jgi:predicted amidophosphoribosyltransferase
MTEDTCPRCQYSLEPDHRFCPQCGLNLHGEPATSSSDPRGSWWARRPGWERALIILGAAAVIAAVVYFLSTP